MGRNSGSSSGVSSLGTSRADEMVMAYFKVTFPEEESRTLSPDQEATLLGNLAPRVMEYEEAAAVLQNLRNIHELGSMETISKKDDSVRRLVQSIEVLILQAERIFDAADSPDRRVMLAQWCKQVYEIPELACVSTRLALAAEPIGPRGRRNHGKAHKKKTP